MTSKAPKKTALEAMAIATALSVTTKDAGSVDISLPAGAGLPVEGIVVDCSDAGSVNSTRAPSAGSGPVDADRPATGGCMVTTVAAGSVNFNGHVRNVDTTGAGAVQIGFIAAQLPMPATGAGGHNALGPGGDVASTAGATVSADGDNGKEEGSKVSWKVAAAALDLLDLANGDKLRAFLVVIAGAAEMHARGAIGRRILYASLAVLLVGIAAYQFGWRFSS